MKIRLTDPDQDRYQRLRMIQWWQQEKLQDANALVVGAGALGNEVVKNLALLGVGKIWILDFDRIETTNLTRSVLFRLEDVGNSKAETLARRAHEMNPDCEAIPLLRDVRFELGLHFLSKMDLIFGCLDNREARYYLNRSCYLLSKTWIEGGLDTLNGSVSVFCLPQTACYECTLGAGDRTELQNRIACLPSSIPETRVHVPTAPTVASIVGGIQVQIGIRKLHDLPIPCGKRIGTYGLSDVFFDICLEISADCGLHSAVDPLPLQRESMDLPVTSKLAHILKKAHNSWNASALNWDFDRDITAGIQCMNCDKKLEVYGAPGMISYANCSCGGVYKPNIRQDYSGTEPWGEYSFPALGFPPDHIYCAITPESRVFFTLKGE